MKLANVKGSTYFDYCVESDDKDPKVGDSVGN